MHDIQTIVADLRHRGIGVLISDHNVEQTLDIVDRAYIMFDGQVKVSGTVRELVFDDTVADIYLGPTLTARLRARFARPTTQGTGDARMRAGLSQNTQLKQELKINPRLYQAMDLLYMPLLDLQQHLKQELLNNPFLDMVEPEEEEEEEGEDQQESRSRSGGREEKEQRRDRLGGDPPRRLRRRRPPRGARGARVLRAGHRRHARPLRSPARPGQRCSTSTPRQQFLADEFIGNINEDGYLACALEKILDGVNESVEQAPPRSRSATSTTCRSTRWRKSRRCSRIIQSLDPPGVGARDLRECLMLQLREAGLEQSVPFRLVRDCFEELINHRWSEISKRFGISPSDVQKAADEIAKLDPKPGLVYSDASDNYIIPDLIVDKIDGKYHVFLNDANLPRLKLSKRVPGDRARQEEVRGREQGVHLQQAQLGQLDDPGDRAAPADDAQGHELHRRPAARVLREGRAVPQAAHAARGGRSDQHARVAR